MIIWILHYKLSLTSNKALKKGPKAKVTLSMLTVRMRPPNCLRPPLSIISHVFLMKRLRLTLISSFVPYTDFNATIEDLKRLPLSKHFFPLIYAACRCCNIQMICVTNQFSTQKLSDIALGSDECNICFEYI